LSKHFKRKMRLSSLLRSSPLPNSNGDSWVRVLEYGRYRPSPLSMSHFILAGKTSTLQQSFAFLRREVPIRMAGVLLEMKLLPDSLQNQHGFEEIRGVYKRSFEELLAFGKKADLDEFTETMISMRARHADTIPTMAGAVMAMKDQVQNDEGEMDAGIDDAVQYFLNRMYMSHISIRMLINQYAFAHGSDIVKPGHIGMIDPYCDVATVINKAYTQAAKICDQHYGAHPGLKLSVNNNCEKGNIPIQFVYVPRHLFHICFEIIKNSMRATMEFHSDTGEYPDLQMTVAKSISDVTLRLSDVGGGIERELIPNLFKYTYTTASGEAHKKALAGDNTVMAGLGYGLPLSRLYAQYFHGNMAINSLSGYGTDTYVYLKAIEEDAPEKLPLYSHKETSKVYKRKQERGPADWTDVVDEGLESKESVYEYPKFE